MRSLAENPTAYRVMKSTPSNPSTPTATPASSGSKTTLGLFQVSLPTSRRSTASNGKVPEPTTPWTVTALAGIDCSSAFPASSSKMTEMLAPVSSRKRYGPSPLTRASMTMRPLRSILNGTAVKASSSSSTPPQPDNSMAAASPASPYPAVRQVSMPDFLVLIILVTNRRPSSFARCVSGQPPGFRYGMDPATSVSSIAKN